jgi:hypothetical protein
VNRYNTSLTAMGQIPPKDLLMAKRRVALGTCAIRHGMSPCAIWKPNKNNGINMFIESS